MVTPEKRSCQIAIGQRQCGVQPSALLDEETPRSGLPDSQFVIMTCQPVATVTEARLLFWWTTSVGT